MYRFLLFAIVVFLANSSFAQQRVLTGKVVDAATQSALANATVSILGQSTGATLTDENGNFSMSLSGGQTIVVSYTGYAPATINIGESQTSVTVSLTQSVAGMDEVVVIGYGTQRRKDLTSAISSVSSEQLREMPVTNVNMALQGRVPGLQIVSGGNEPGAGTKARIRGINSINVENGPLYVIDGVITTGDIREINPEDIESIDVLKDASAASIYGSRAAEGVIIITTKKAKVGKASINYSGYYGTQKPVQKYKFINGQEYEQIRRQAYYDNNPNPNFLNDTTADKRFDAQMFNALELQSIRDGKSYDWLSQILKTAPIQSHTLSVSSGTERNRLYISGNYFNQGGIIKNSNMKRYSLNMSGETQITSKLKALLSTNISHIDNNILDQQVFYNALTISPLTPFVDAQGNSTIVEDPTKGTLFVINNPNTLVQYPKYKNDDRFLGSLALEYKIIKELQYRTSFSADIYMNKTSFYAPRTVNINNSYRERGYGSIENFNYRDYTFDNTLTYDKNFAGNHSVSALAGIIFQKRRQEYNWQTGTGFPSDKTTFKDMNLASVRNIGSNFFNWGLTSQIGRVIYKFKERYILNGSIRRDGSSYFGENNRYGVFPSISAAWRLIDEPFMLKTRDVLSDAKFRIGYGVIGNYNRNYYAIYSAMSSTAYPFNGQNNISGFQINPSYLMNKDLRWEAQHQFNVGLDLGLFNNRAVIAADYYNKNIRNLLMDLELPPSAGYARQTINVAEMNTKGFDFRIKVDLIKTSDFQWQTELNYSKFTSKVTSLQPGIDSLRPDLKVGEAPNSLIIGYVYDGLYQVGDSVMLRKLNAKPGSVKVRDMNNDGLLNANDMTIIGRTTPKGWGGLWNYWRYKGISLTVFASYMFGHDIFNIAYQDYMYADGRRVVMKEALNYWTPTNTNTDIPRPNAFGEAVKTLPNGYSSFAVQRADFIKIRNITLGYDLPSTLLNKIRLSSANIYLQFTDPFIFTNYKGVDPEITQINTGTWSGGSATSSYDIYPRYRSTILGLRIGL